MLIFIGDFEHHKVTERRERIHQTTVDLKIGSHHITNFIVFPPNNRSRPTTRQLLIKPQLLPVAAVLLPPSRMMKKGRLIRSNFYSSFDCLFDLTAVTLNHLFGQMIINDYVPPFQSIEPFLYPRCFYH